MTVEAIDDVSTNGQHTEEFPKLETIIDSAGREAEELVINNATMMF